MTKVICNCCGKEISSVAFHMDEIMPYGSEHDGDLFTSVPTVWISLSKRFVLCAKSIL